MLLLHVLHDLTVLFQRWFDYRLAWNQTAYNISRVVVPPSDVWLPDLYLQNWLVALGISNFLEGIRLEHIQGFVPSTYELNINWSVAVGISNSLEGIRPENILIRVKESINCEIGIRRTAKCHVKAYSIQYSLTALISVNELITRYYSDDIFPNNAVLMLEQRLGS